MLIKKELMKIKPKAPMTKNREVGKKYYCYAVIENDILAVFVYKYETNELIYRFYCDGKNYIVYDGEDWCLKNIDDYVGWYSEYKIQYYRNSSGIINTYLDGYNEGLSAVRSWIWNYNYKKKGKCKS